MTFRKGRPLERRVKAYIAWRARDHAPMAAETSRIIRERVRVSCAKRLVREQRARERAACRQSKTPPTAVA